jgi:hypothetical protein
MAEGQHFEPLGPSHGIPIGWLSPAHAFDKGPVSEEFFEKLVFLLKAPWQIAVSAGFHRCEFCRFSGGMRELSYKGHQVSMGSSNAFIPDGERFYVVPSLILHYIDAHEFQPPPDFQDAVLRCPPMRSMDYFKAIRKAGVKPSGG